MHPYRRLLFAGLLALSLIPTAVMAQERAPSATGVPSESVLDAPHEADAAAPKGVEETPKGPDAEEKKEADEEEKEAEIDPSVQPLQALYNSVVESWCCVDPGFKDVKLTGYIDQTFTHNFNRPFDRNNTLRVYDRKHDRYLLNMFQLYAVKDPTEVSRWGFAARLTAGWDADINSGFEEYNRDKADIEELYGSYLVDIGNGILIKAGKFVTLAGAEVIEQKDNFNISRSYMFGFGGPFTHTGVRAQYKINDTYDVTMGLVRGWDSFRQDNNDALTFESRLGITCSEKLSLAIVGYHGPEQVGNESNDRTLIDLVATYKFTDKLTGVVNLDFATEEEAAADGGDARWGAIVGYLRYECNDKLSFAGRSEWFRDTHGTRTGTSQSLTEHTVTAQYKFRENVWGRLEYRHDFSTEDVFTRRDGVSGSQNTIAASMLITF